MNSIRQQLLDAELKRIEDQAEANSFAIMNKADALLAAHNLCQRVNAAEPGVCEFTPHVCYGDPNGGHCSILIYTRNDGDVFLRRLQAEGLKYEVDGFAYEGHQSITVEGFKGVTVIIPSTFFLPHEVVAAA